MYCFKSTFFKTCNRKMQFLLNGTFGDFKRKTWWLQFTNYLDALYLPQLKVTTKTLFD